MGKQSQKPPSQGEASEQSVAETDAVEVVESAPVDPAADTVPAKPGALRRDVLEGQPTDEPEAPAAVEPVAVPAAEEPPAPVQAPAEPPVESESEPVYAVAPKRGLTSLRGILGEGETVSARDFHGGQSTLDHLVEVGSVVKS